MKNDYPDDKEIERKDKIIEIFNTKNRRDLTQLCLNSDVILLADLFENSIKSSINEFYINPLCCVSLPGCTWQCALIYTDNKLKHLKIKNH